MGVVYYPGSMELREGHSIDIRDAGKFLASMRKVDPTEKQLSASAGPNTNTGFGAYPNYVIGDIAPELAVARKSQVQKALVRRAMDRGDTSLNTVARYNQLTRSADINDSSIHQITIVQFVQQMIGRINAVNVVTRAFTRIPADNLRGKIPEGGAPGVNVQVKRLSEPKIVHTDFGQTEFRIRRNDLHLYINREDRMEATIDPLAFSSSQGQIMLMQVRDLLALKELSRAPAVSTVFPGGQGSIGSTDGSRVPRAEADSIGLFQQVVINHWTKWKKMFRYVIMHPDDYRIHETNYYSRNKMLPNPATPWGISPFAGLEKWGLQAILSPWVPRRRAYFLTDEGAYELDGPKVVDSEYDARKFADYFPVRDFVGYLLVHPARFSGKVDLNIMGVALGDEITTDEKVEELVGLPEENTVDKNDDA